MNSLRLRLVILKPIHGAGPDFIYAIQVSQDGLNWWTLHRGKELDPTLAKARELDAFIKANTIVKEESVLWESKRF